MEIQADIICKDIFKNISLTFTSENNLCIIIFAKLTKLNEKREGGIKVF